MNLLKKRVPEVHQIEAAECGAASLCMILGYYGRYIDLGQMRKDCHISRDGSRLSYIMEAAKKHGMRSDAYRADPDLQGRKLPLIAFWRYSHFLVVEEINDKYVFIVDPASGRRKITRDEFAANFSGIVLELSCTDKFETCGHPFNPVLPLVRLISNYKGTLLYLVILATMINLVGFILPSFTKIYVDYYLANFSNAQIGNYYFIFALVLAMQAILLVIRKHVNIRFRRIQSANMTSKVTGKLLKLPLAYFGTRSHSTIDMNLKDIDSLTDFVSSNLVPVFLDIFFSLIYIVLLFKYSVVVAVPTVLLIVLLVTIIFLLLRLSRSATVKASIQYNGWFGSVAQNVRLFDTIKSLAMEEDAFLNSMRKFSSWQEASQASGKILAILQAVPVAVPLIIQLFVVSIGSSQVISGKMTIGTVLACQSIAMSIFAPIVQMIAQFTMLQGQEVRIKALEDIVKQEDDPAFHKEECMEDACLDGEVELKGVSFGYNTLLPPVISDISFHLKKGDSIAFVGGSGSGKSTVLKLIEGLYTPQKGQILFGGLPQEKLSRELLSGEIAVVSQTPFIFAGSVRENISLFDRSIDIQEIKDALNIACVFDAIESHAGGINARMSATDSSFSGGEIQRIMIARAVVRKPKILILDEATSALDTLVEQKVMDNIKALGITLLVVAHRLSAIRDCDEIIVMDKGVIVERGNHEQLSSKEGLYKQLMSSEEYNES